MTKTNYSCNSTKLMLVLPLPILWNGESLFIDKQAYNGIHQWLNNFNSVTICMPQINISGIPTDTMRINDIDFEGRCRIVRLPNQRKAIPFFKSIFHTKKILDQLIDESTHLCFAIGGLFGDWAAVAALCANKKRRKAAIWTDRVESSVFAFTGKQSKGLRGIYWSIMALVTRHFERLVIKRSALGLFHGADCFAAYAPYSKNPHLVHDIHLSKDMQITHDELNIKIHRLEKLTIVYAGRVHPDKGPLEWIECLKQLSLSGVEYKATWYGDGPQLHDARSMVKSAALEDKIIFIGKIEDHAALMGHMRQADLFIFCHKTLESPRCLIESLMSGTPIVGYKSDYPADLIKVHSGGILTDSKPSELAKAIIILSKDRGKLANLIKSAAADGSPFTDAHVFKHRSDLIKDI